MKFLVLGATYGGVFIARQLRRFRPDSYISMIGFIHDVGQYSSSINRYYAVKSTSEIAGMISQVYHDGGERTIKAFIASNVMLEYIVSSFPDAFSFISFENDFDFYRTFTEKRLTISLLGKLNVRIPKTYEINSSLDIASIRFPVVLKPNDKYMTDGMSKCQVINSREELESTIGSLSSCGISCESIICQQLVNGNNKYEYGYGGYFVNGNPKVDICFYQFRQYKQGLCCYVREISDPDLLNTIREFVSPILRETKANGFIEFDIKEDIKDGMLYLLDVNPRPWRSADMLLAKLDGASVFEPKISSRKVVWRQPSIEILRSGSNLNVPYRECRKLTGDKGYITKLSMWDRNDMKPFWIQLKRDLVSIFSTK